MRLLSVFIVVLHFVGLLRIACMLKSVSDLIDVSLFLLQGQESEVRIQRQKIHSKSRSWPSDHLFLADVYRSWCSAEKSKRQNWCRTHYIRSGKMVEAGLMRDKLCS